MVGYIVIVHYIGNIFTVRVGRVRDAALIIISSHFDIQLIEGRYNGILSIISGLEVLRTLYKNDYETRGPVSIVN
jgi:hypothetical protein